ncbi:hypothetical protein GCM10010129_71510 [Streptomyces fumigatiscleroticus]|nr:hypothetical protein GCM10010129_71510 [Streptomyces fumigatiscleroticus]
MDAEPGGCVTRGGMQVHGDGAREAVSPFGGMTTHLADEDGCHRQRAVQELPVDLRGQFDDEGVGRHDVLSAENQGLVVALPQEY